MASQLGQLADLAAAPWVTLQVLPLATAPPVLTSSFTLLTLAGTPDVACATSSSGQHHLTTRDTAVTALHAAFTALAGAALAPGDSAAVLQRIAACPPGGASQAMPG
jgi:hypothetical protein